MTEGLVQKPETSAMAAPRMNRLRQERREVFQPKASMVSGSAGVLALLVLSELGLPALVIVVVFFHQFVFLFFGRLLHKPIRNQESSAPE
jgi:hypothetical protein